MSKPLKPKRGTTAQNDAYIGEAHEVTLDTEKHTLRVHDGVTPGGWPVVALTDSVSVVSSGVEQKTAVTPKGVAEELKKYLPLTGGTMTGAIWRNGLVVQTKDAGQSIFFRGGVEGEGSGAELHLMDDAASYLPGCFILRAGSGGTLISLLGKPDKSLLWNGVDVITAAGGTIKGDLFVASILGQSGDTLGIYGGVGWRQGGYIELYAPDSSYPNALTMRGADDTLLQGLTDGWKIAGSPILTLVSRWIDSTGNWYRKYSDGWIEQGGRVLDVSGDSSHAVTFHLPMSAVLKIDWFLVGETTKDSEGGPSVKGISSTGFTIQNWMDNSAGYVYWEAKGYA